MATLPRSGGTKSAFVKHPQLEFDSGINSSAAWAESHKPGAPAPVLRRNVSESNANDRGSLSDEEPDDEEGGRTRRARALYDFQGKAEFRELDVEAGDEIEIVKEDVGEGWSLVRNATGEMGLLPREYYTVRYHSYLLTSELIINSVHLRAGSCARA
jgi:sorting nexin-9/18/33